MMTNAKLSLKKFSLIYVYIIVNYLCLINATVLKRENDDLIKFHNLVLPIYQKVTGKTMREYPLLGYKIKKCLSHYYKNLKKPEHYIEDSEEIGRLPNKHDSNLTSLVLKGPKEKQIDIKSEDMEINELISKSSADNLFNAIIVGEQTTIESVEDQELYDGIIVGESEEEDSGTTFQPIMKSDRQTNNTI